MLQIFGADPQGDDPSSQLVLRQMHIDLSKHGSSRESDIGSGQTEGFHNGFREHVVNFDGTAQGVVKALCCVHNERKSGGEKCGRWKNGAGNISSA